jgi:hypothetical protein
MKRVTLAIYDKWIDAFLITKYLHKHGFDVKHVQKHAVQAHPDQEQAIKDFMSKTKLPEIWRKE